MNRKRPTISVVVCTYNRAEILAECVQSLTKQIVPSECFEILIVDNNSSDATPLLCKKFEGGSIAVRYFHEAKQGLSHARNRGWMEALSDWVAYVDDDCRIPAGWLEKACEIIETLSPDIFGGPYYPFFLTPKPVWFKDEYGSHVIDHTARPLGPGEYLDGGNIFFRRALIEELGGFDPCLGMAGTVLAYGEETALQIKARETMLRPLIYYDPRLFVHHLVPHYKLKLDWILKQHARIGISTARMVPGKDLPAMPSLFWRMLLALGYLHLGILCSLMIDREKYPHFQNYLIEQVFPHLRSLSHACTLLGRRMFFMKKEPGTCAEF